MNCKKLTIILCCAAAFQACHSTSVQREEVSLPGLQKPVEILRDRWGVPHIYAQTSHDLFFAQGYTAARDRLFQIDLWRRVGTGKLAEVFGPSAVPRDRIARLVRFRGDWNAEWQSYSPDAKQIAAFFTAGINAYIQSLGGNRPLEFRIAGYNPGLWTPEDVVARVAGLLMTRNLTREVARVQDIKRFGLETVQKYLPPDPLIAIKVPNGLNLDDVTAAIVRDYGQAIRQVRFSGEQGSNNWVVDGTMSVTGRPLLANDPHRPIVIPSLRKTVHLVGPGWNAIGAGEPALPGIALGHNADIGFGFTIVGIDQGDLYVEQLNPANPEEYRYRHTWKKMEIERQEVAVKGSATPQTVELRYTLHGPVIYQDLARRRAYALRWVGSEPGTAGYYAGVALARAENWKEFLEAVKRYKVPSENLVYADRAGNIGWIASGLAPIRKNWSGLLPVPGDTGEYEWSGFLPIEEHPQLYNPSQHYIATANHNILPPGYDKQLGYEWAAPFRYQRLREMLSEGKKFSVADFERMQQDVTSLPARRFQAILRKWNPPAGSRAAKIVEQLLNWDARVTRDSVPATIYEVWIARLPAFVFGPALGARTDLRMLLKTLEASPNPKALSQALDQALGELEKALGPKMEDWRWGRIHEIYFRHPLPRQEFHRGPIARPGDGFTVNSTSGANFRRLLSPSPRLQRLGQVSHDKRPG
jgi:penicillin amidase